MSAFLFINAKTLKRLYRFKLNKSVEFEINNVSKALVDDDDNGKTVNNLLSVFDKITLNKENGINVRSFYGNVNIGRHRDYQSILVMAYNGSVSFPNRVTPYRNHFCVYTGLDDSVVIVRSETTLRYQDHDAVLQYDVLKLSDNKLTTTCRDRWIISYDSCVSSSTKCPDNFLNYVLCCSGEWWFFDRGIILNGVQEINSLLIYYELHAKYQLKRREVLQLFPPLSETKSTITSPSLIDKSTLPKFAQLISENEILGGENVSPIATTNDNIVNDASHSTNTIVDEDRTFEPLPRPRLNTILPSSWWFIERDKELQKGDINYFIPR